MGNYSLLHGISPCVHIIASHLLWFIPEKHFKSNPQCCSKISCWMPFTELLSACILVLSTSGQVANANLLLTMLHYTKKFQNKTCALYADCPFGTYGVECRKTCNCKGGICDRETGTCLTLKFFARIASKLRSEPQAGKSSFPNEQLWCLQSWSAVSVNRPNQRGNSIQFIYLSNLNIEPSAE